MAKASKNDLATVATWIKISNWVQSGGMSVELASKSIRSVKRANMKRKMSELRKQIKSTPILNAQLESHVAQYKNYKLRG